MLHYCSGMFRCYVIVKLPLYYLYRNCVVVVVQWSMLLLTYKMLFTK
jgi:hypothetical protein